MSDASDLKAELLVLKAENAKLRELVRNLYACINNCDYCEYVDEAFELARNMRELGVDA